MKALGLKRSAGTSNGNLGTSFQPAALGSQAPTPVWTPRLLQPQLRPGNGLLRAARRADSASTQRRTLLGVGTAALLTAVPHRPVAPAVAAPKQLTVTEPVRLNGSQNGSGCNGDEPGPPECAKDCRPANPPLRITAPGRVVAVGDIHGDLQKAVSLFKLAGCVEEVDRRLVWTGGNTTVVQLGDVLDRGSQEIASLQLLRNLDTQARAEGGAVWMINGNHESLNVAGDFRYATEGGLLESAIMGGLRGVEAHLLPNQRAARMRLFAPGGHLAKELAHNPTVLIVNDTMFAHGGVLMGHVQYGLERINAEVAAWMRGDRLADGSHAPPPFLAMGDRRSVMWNRTFSQECFSTLYDKYHASNQLRQVLERTGCKRLIIGHTPQQQGLNSELDGMVWRVDVGMSSGVLNAMPQALEIGAKEGSREPDIRVLGEACGPQLPAMARGNPFLARSFGSIGAVSRL